MTIVKPLSEKHEKLLQNFFVVLLLWFDMLILSLNESVKILKLL